MRVLLLQSRSWRQGPYRRASLLVGCLLFIVFSVTSIRGGYANPARLPSSLRLSRGSLLEDASNATLGFQKIFVIGLPLRTDRRDSMSLAAAYTGLEIEYVDGVTHVANKTLPPEGVEHGLNAGSLGNWRAHLNVMRLIVERNIAHALIIEDDADFDIRIKSQMLTFAKASRLLLQPVKGTSNQRLDPTYPQPLENETYTDFDVDSGLTSEPTTSPYGDVDRWDLLWLGHCGARFPWASDMNAPLGRVVISNDSTVPEPQHLDVELGDLQLQMQYPPHTRVVSRARVNSCTLAYGVSNPGAKRILWELGVHKMTDPTDTMLRYMCDGVQGRQLATCLSVQPQLFQHHRPGGHASSFSDINDHGAINDDYRENATTANIRWSVRLNFSKFVSGDTDYIDSYPDGESNGNAESDTSDEIDYLNTYLDGGSDDNAESDISGDSDYMDSFPDAHPDGRVDAGIAADME